MSVFLFANNASSVLASSLAIDALALVVTNGGGLQFSNPQIGEEFRCLLFDATGNREIIGVTSRSSDNFGTITRGMEGTSARVWPAGTPISQRLTKEILEQFELPVTHETPVSGAVGIPISSDYLSKHINVAEIPDPHEQYILGGEIDQTPTDGNTENPVSSDWLAKNILQQNYIRVRDAKTSGINAGTFSSGAWRTRTLNVLVTNTIDGATFANDDVIVLPTGKYYIEASAPARRVDGHMIRLYNTNTFASMYGESEFSDHDLNDAPATRSRLKGYFEVTDNFNGFELQHRCKASQSDTGLGVATDFGVTENYTEVMIWRIPQ